MKTYLQIGGLALVGALVLPAAFAADHIDSPAAIAEPTADITDLFAWMSPDANHLNMVLAVHPFASSASTFSSAVQYVFHVNSSTEYGGAADAAEVICQFDDDGMIECWGGGSYVSGDPSDPAGLLSDDGMLKVYAGLRDDPFFFELDGFNNAVAAVIDAASDLTFDGDGCPALDGETSNALIGLLQSGNDDAPASDTLAGANVLALVVQIDKAAVTTGGPLVGVWASTHRGN